MDAAELDRIARRFGIVLLLQFGSSITGRLHARSDVDLGVLLERPALSLSGRSELLHEVQRLFPDREVDLAVLNHADPLLLKRVMDRCTLLHGSARRRHELAMYAFRRYHDHRRYFDMEREYVRRRLSPATC
ncbi:MAG: nucleotidyltransferase domain-containing protein [Candidatus Rokubacteria bacterium]|nr:nucleotidyltransferase domain-containing protein [Candidatus Rokubacteria bacterium]